MPTLLSQLASSARERGLLAPDADLDAAAVFALVRDMPYRRASDRRPETIIREWRGTCSGKHYLLKALFAGLGLPAHLIACTIRLDLPLDSLPAPLDETLRPTNGRFVDVHNYLIVTTPQGEMIVDATWPAGMQKLGLVVNERFVPGEDQQIAYQPDETWIVPDDVDAQAFKNDLLQAHFTAVELSARDAFIETLSAMLGS